MGVDEMKGQVFIIISIFVLIFLLSLRIGTQTTDIKSEDIFINDYDSLKRELVNTIDLSLVNRQSVQNNLNSFISFSTDFYKRKDYTEDIDYTIIEDGDVTTVYLNISMTSDSSYLKQSIIINRTTKVFT